MNNVIAATSVFLVTIIASRAITNKANKKLDTPKKAELVDLFAKNRLGRFLFLSAVIILFLVNTKYEFVDMHVNFIMYILFLAGFMIFIGIQTYRDLKKNEFPGEYIRSITLASCLRCMGLVLFVVLIMFPF